MSLVTSLRAAFAKPSTPTIRVDEAAWSEPTLYRGADFPKYNPDDLMSRKGYAIYRKMMNDEQIKAVVRFKRDAITSRDYIFELGDDGLSEEESQARKDLFKTIIAKMNAPFSDALNGIMSSMTNGFSITEKLLCQIEHNGKTWYGINRLKLRPCDTFYFHVDAYGNVEKVTQQLGVDEQTVDLPRFIHFVQNPDVDEHYGRSELRECYRAWFSKDMVIKFQNIHLERFAAGFVWAAPKEGKTIVANSPEYAALKQVMQNLQATSSIILPSGIELNIEHPATTDAFERAISQHDKSIAKALLVPNLMGISEQGSTGSYSQSQTQLEAFLWTLEADATRLEEALNSQLFRELGDLNWGDGIYPRFKFKPISDTRKLEVVKIWTQLVTAGAVQATDLDEAHIRDALEMPKKATIEGNAPDLILNGAQVISLVGIINSVGKGEMTPEAGKALITAVFPISEQQASAMVDKAKVEKPEPAAPVIDPATGLPASQQGAQGIDPAAKPEPKGVAPLPDETIVGKMGVSVSAFTKAMKRVDFAVIGNKADNSSKDAAYQCAVINSEVVARLVSLAEELKLGTAEGNPDDIKLITYTAAEMSALKAAATLGLKDAWAIGESHAKKELAKARGAAFGAWNEDDHPRDDNGRFGDGGGGTPSSDVIAGIKEYTARGGELHQRNPASTAQKEALREWLASGTTGTNITLWQGTAYSSAEWEEQWTKLTTPGNEIKLPSQSFSEDRVRTGGYKGGAEPVKFELVGGMRGRDIQAYSVYKEEAEHLAAEGNTYKVIGWDRTPSGINIIKIKNVDVYNSSILPHKFATNDLALQDVAASYIKQKGYILAGDISNATQKTIRNILMEGVKVSKTHTETKQAIYKALESDGMLTEEAVQDALGTTTVKSTNARIETAIRTTSFEAINEARYQLFSDPELGGFVEALEYSAILDDRTTDICSQLNGETYSIDSEVWSTFRPPNHFNCRSILVPVTARDTWTPSDEPSGMPQKGFGFTRRPRC